jgi:hypothetical protein
MSTAIANYGNWEFLLANALIEPDADRLPWSEVRTLKGPGPHHDVLRYPPY